MEPQQPLTIDNPGNGDCGYYAVCIGLIPYLLEEIQNLFEDDIKRLDLSKINIKKLNDKLNENKAGYLEKIKNNPEQFSCLNQILINLEAQKCRFDNPQEETEFEPEIQKAHFFNWIVRFNYLHEVRDINNNEIRQKLLLPGVYLLRSLLSSLRKDSIDVLIAKLNELVVAEKNKVENSKKILAIIVEKQQYIQQAIQQQEINLNDPIPKELLKELLDDGRLRQCLSDQEIAVFLNKQKPEQFYFSEQKKLCRTQNKQEVDNPLEALSLGELQTLLEKKAGEEKSVAERSSAEIKLQALTAKDSANLDRPKLHDDILEVLNKTLGGTGGTLLPSLFLGDTRIKAINNQQLKDFSKQFTTWWKKHHGDHLPDFFKERGAYYKFQSFFIAILYGNIDFFEKTLEEVELKVNNWWENPDSFEVNPLLYALAEIPNQMQLWSTEIDLITLANQFETHLEIHHNQAQNINFEDLSFRTIVLQNLSSVHWKTLIDINKKPALGVLLDFNAYLQFQLEAQTIAEELHKQLEELEELLSSKSISDNKQKKQILQDLKGMLDLPEPSPHKHKDLVKALQNFKTTFNDNLPKLKEGLDPKGKSILRKIWEFICKILRIRINKTLSVEDLNDVKQSSDKIMDRPYEKKSVEESVEENEQPEKLEEIEEENELGSDNENRGPKHK